MGKATMKGNVRPLMVLSLIILVFSSFYCGVDLVEEGRKSFSNGDYTQAINYLTEAQKEDSIDRSNDNLIFLAYLYRGEELYQKTRNVKAFEGNFTEAQKYYPQNPTAEFNNKFVTMILSLANAYHETKPRNAEEQELYFENALKRVKQALVLDTTNTAADSMLALLKTEQFQNLVDKGENYFNRAGKTGNADLYFTAKYYLKEALEFEPDNKKINNLLEKIVQKTLPVLNYREGVSMAVAGFSRERKAIIMTISIKNYTTDPVSLNLNNFNLVDNDGNKFYVNEDEMKKRELFGEACIKNTILNQNNPSIEGIIAFNAPSDVNLDYINYTIDRTNFSRKYFP